MFVPEASRWLASRPSGPRLLRRGSPTSRTWRLSWPKGAPTISLPQKHLPEGVPVTGSFRGSKQKVAKWWDWKAGQGKEQEALNLLKNHWAAHAERDIYGMQLYLSKAHEGERLGQWEEGTPGDGTGCGHWRVMCCPLQPSSSLYNTCTLV